MRRIITYNFEVQDNSMRQCANSRRKRTLMLVLQATPQFNAVSIIITKGIKCTRSQLLASIHGGGAVAAPLGAHLLVQTMNHRQHSASRLSPFE